MYSLLLSQLRQASLRQVPSPARTAKDYRANLDKLSCSDTVAHHTTRMQSLFRAYAKPLLTLLFRFATAYCGLGLDV